MRILKRCVEKPKRSGAGFKNEKEKEKARKEWGLVSPFLDLHGVRGECLPVPQEKGSDSTDSFSFLRKLIQIEK